MSSKISEHDNTQGELDNTVLDSFNLFLSLMTPLEFAKLLRSRVSHLLQAWPPPSPSDNSQGQNDTSSSSNKTPYLSMDSVLAFTSFFRTQDTPTMSESGAKFTPSSNHIHQHLKALETLLSCLAPKELQELIKSRLKEGDKERTDAIRGLMDVMRRAVTIDETPEDKTLEEKSSLHLTLVSNVEESETPSTNTYTVNLSPGTAHIPRVMSPGTRDQSADDSNVQHGGSQKTGSQFSRKHELRQSTPLLSPVVSTSKVSISPITIPTKRGNRHNTKFESPSPTKGKEAVLKSPGSRPSDSTSKSKSSASSPYSKVPQSTRRTRSSGALVSEPSTSRNQAKVLTPEKPRRKSERISKRTLTVTRLKKNKQSLKKEPSVPPSSPSDTTKPLPPTSSAATSSRNELSPVGASDHASSSFFHPSADGRKSPPGPVLRAVDWSTPISSDEDHEMEEEEEELDELADDSSEGGNHVSEIVDGWNSHMVDGEQETASPPSQAEPPLTDRTSPIPTTPVLKEELVPSEAVLTLPPEPGSPIPPLISSRSSPSVIGPTGSTDGQSIINESSNAALITVPQDHPMEVDLPPQISPELPPSASTTPILAPPIPPPVYLPLYSNSLPPPGRNSYPPVGLPTLENSPPHSSQPPPASSIHHSPHTPDVATHSSYAPSSQPPPAVHNHVNPYPPPPPNHSYTHDYHASPPPHIPPYPSQHPPYTLSPWYGTPYYPHLNHQPPPYHQYPQQPSMPMPLNRDQHPVSHLQPSHPPHSQSYPYPQQPPPIPPPQFPPMQTSQPQFPPQPSVNPYHHLPPSFPPSALSTSYPHPSSSTQQQQQGLNDPHYPPPQSTLVHLPHHFLSPHSHVAQPSAHLLHDNFSSDTTGSRSSLYTMNNSVPMTMPAPRPPSPIIPPPLGPRPPPPVNINSLPPPQRRSPSPPVKPPEGPKRFFQKRRTDEEGGDLNFQGAGGGDQDDPNVRYTSEVGIKETSSVRRRCHNCRTVEAPSWRKSKLSIGKILCNKCGIYESTHLMARPLKTRPRRLMLNGERDPYQFEIYNASPITPSGSPTSSGVKRRRTGSTSDNDDDFDIDE